MSDSTPEQKSWWSTLPGIVSAIAALLTAATGFYVSVIRAPVSPPQEDPCKALPVDQRPITCLEEQQHTRLLADKTSRASVIERDLRAKTASLEAASITEREKQIGQLLSNQRPIKSPASDVASTPILRNGTASKLVQQGSTDKPPSRADTTPVQTIFENEYFKAIATSVRFSSDRRNIRVTVELHNKNAAPLYLAINSFSSTEPAATTESGDKFESVQISGLKSIASLREDTYEQSSNYTAIPEVGSIRTTWELTSKHGEPPAQGKLLELTAELLRLSDSGPKRVSFVAPKVVL